MPTQRARIDKLIKQWDPVLRRGFMESIAQMRAAGQLDVIEKALARGDIEAALRAVNLDPLTFRPWDKAIQQAFEAGGTTVTQSLPTLVDAASGLRTVFQFNVRNPEAERYLFDRSSTKVVEIINDQRNMIRTNLTAGLEAGNNPRTMALDLVGRVNPGTGRREGGFIGLTSSQENWVRNYREELVKGDPGALVRQLRDKRFDATIAKAIARGEPIPDGVISSAVTNYKNRALRYRAENIARTEAMTSLHEAQAQAMQQAIAGGLNREDIVYTWRATNDERTRDSHAEMDGQTVREGELFVTGDGNTLEYPGDPNGPPEETINCRCWREVGIDFLANLGPPPKRPRPKPKPKPKLRPEIDDAQVRTLATRAQFNSYVNELPDSVLETLAKDGQKFRFGSALTEIYPELKGVRPRGWAPGTTWDSAEGLHRNSTKEIALTEFHMREGNMVRTNRPRGVLFHETGHGFDQALGDESKKAAFREAYMDDVYGTSEADREKHDYYFQSGDAGPSEAFAEIFSWVVGETGAGYWFDLRTLFPSVTKYIKGLI